MPLNENRLSDREYQPLRSNKGPHHFLPLVAVVLDECLVLQDHLLAILIGANDYTDSHSTSVKA